MLKKQPATKGIWAFVCLAAGVCVLDAGVFANVASAQRNVPPGPPGPSPIVAGKVVQVRRAGTETFVGTLKPFRTSVVGSAVDGRVIEVSVMEGDPVDAPDQAGSPGEPIVKLRTGTLDIEIETAQIQLAISQQALDELEVSLPKEIELARANAAESEARYQYSKNNYERAQRLGGGSGAISEGELEQARSEFLATQQLAEGFKVQYERLVATENLKRLQLKLRVDASRQELARLDDLKDKYTIYAPFDGLVTRKVTEVGEWVTQGQPLFEVVQLNPIEMIINLPQEHLGRLQKSLSSASSSNPLTALIEFDGFEEHYTGIVKRVISQADLRSRTLPVRIEIQNPKTESGHPLQPGMLGKASMMIGEEQDMLLVKKDSLVLGGRQPAVYKIVRDGDDVTAIPVPVETGTSVGDWIQITGDIKATDSVVLLGNERLRPGQKLEITRTSDEVPPESAP
jgi:RND family efflux transporter MFP subunit